MKKKNIKIALISMTLSFGILCNAQTQSNIARIIPNGIVDSSLTWIGEAPIIRVATTAVLAPELPDPMLYPLYYTGFWISNRYWDIDGVLHLSFDGYLDNISRRLFYVKKGDEFNKEAIVSGTAKEINWDDSTFSSEKFYIGVYTGTSPSNKNGIYSDPLYGWIRMDCYGNVLKSAQGYKCKGIIVGTEELIVPTISYQVEGKTITLTYSDSLYESTDGKTWTKVTDAEEGGTYTVDISKSGSKLYCSIMDEVPSR